MGFKSRKFIMLLLCLAAATLMQAFCIFTGKDISLSAYHGLLAIIATAYCAGNTATKYAGRG